MKRIRNRITQWLEGRELARLRHQARYQPGQTLLFGRRIRIADACTYLVGRKAILEKQVYAFRSSRPDPRIIDCGANIGLSVIAFKQQYPAARVQAYEADPSIFDVMRHNLAAFGLVDVELRNEAVWTTDGSVTFNQEGGASGRVSKGRGDAGAPITVPARRLRDVLAREPVEFLKLDIEGAETQVLRDCAEFIRPDWVRHLFVEYHSHQDEPQTLHEILSLMAVRGYRYHLKESYARQRPFMDASALLGMDLQVDLFAWQPPVES